MDCVVSEAMNVCTRCRLPIAPDYRGRTRSTRHRACVRLDYWDHKRALQQIAPIPRRLLRQSARRPRDYSTDAEKRSWLKRNVLPPYNAYPLGSALLWDLTYRMQRNGFYAKTVPRRQIEVSIRWHLDAVEFAAAHD